MSNLRILCLGLGRSRPPMLPRSHLFPAANAVSELKGIGGLAKMTALFSRVVGASRTTGAARPACRARSAKLATSKGIGSGSNAIVFSIFAAFFFVTSEHFLAPMPAYGRFC